MPIFNNKVLQKHASNLTEIPEDDLAVISSWVEQIKNGSLAKQTEVAIHAPFTSQIMVKLLGYSPYGESDQWNISREYGVAGGAVDLALGNFSSDKSSDVVVAPFELKGAKTKDLDAIMAGRHKTPVQQAWDYAKDIKGAEWVLVSNYIELRLYAVSETSLVYEQFFFEDLLDVGEYAKFKLLLSPENLLGEKTQRILKESLEAEKEISNRLYDDYKYLRESMLSKLISDNSSCSPEELIAPAQKLLDRVLFVAFAEDKGLIPNTTIKKAFEHNDPYNPKPIYHNFIGLFNAIDKGNKSLDIPAYNGGLFAHDVFLDKLIVSDSLCEGFKDLAEYDFDSEVSVTVLGHIFEQSIADLEELTETIQSGEVQKVTSRAKSKAVSGKRKKHGVVYTPDNITQFIVVNTLGTHIEELFEQLFKDYGKYKTDGSIQWKKGVKTELKFWYAWQEKMHEIKVVDPACGSGAFLVAAFDYLYAEYEKVNERIAELTGQRSFLDLNKEILNNNLYGVDINEESIEISKLSLWLKTAERGKPLESLDANFIAGNSLGFDEPAPESSFYWKDSFKEIFENGGFDVVLGNPPYVRQEMLSEIKPWLEKNYDVYHGVLDLYGYFFELGSKLLKPNGRMAYISSSTFFKTGSGEKLREYLSSNVLLEKIIDFGDVQVFEGVTTYPAILVFKKLIPSASEKIHILSVKNKVPDNLQLAFEQNKALMTHKQLGNESWQLEDEKLYAVRKKITNGYPKLEKVYDSPLYGIKTGYNEAFVIDSNIRNEIIKGDPKSKEIIKPFLEGKDLKRWHSQSRDLWLIAIPKYWTRKKMDKNNDEQVSDAEAWEWFSGNYPELARWLLRFETKARKRGDKGEFWWELRACAYYDKFESPKIFYPDITDSSKFHRDIKGSYSGNTGYFLPIDEEGLTSYLNSSLIWFFLTGICDSVRGGFFRMFTQNIHEIPIPAGFSSKKYSFADLEKKLHDKTKERYKCESGFSRRLVDLCPEEQKFKINKKLESWWLLDFTDLQKEIKKAFKGSIPVSERNDWQDFFENEKNKRDMLNNEAVELESVLNKEVYELFKLTEEEIELIESAV
ncbi:MAG: N-6 DNA methylase [Candidatus Sedimenticola sp. 20ELBAFRAG]